MNRITKFQNILLIRNIINAWQSRPPAYHNNAKRLHTMVFLITCRSRRKFAFAIPNFEIIISDLFILELIYSIAELSTSQHHLRRVPFVAISDFVWSYILTWIIVSVILSFIHFSPLFIQIRVALYSVFVYQDQRQ